MYQQPRGNVKNVLLIAIHNMSNLGQIIKHENDFSNHRQQVQASQKKRGYALHIRIGCWCGSDCRHVLYN